jgi:hypothetical protein
VHHARLSRTTRASASCSPAPTDARRSVACAR